MREKEERMNLSENGFAVLGASPADDRRTLTMKADEASLLGGEDAEAAFHQLIQMNRRIQEELSWFPGSTREAAEAFLDFSRQTAGGQSVPIPPMDGIGSVLAQANAVSPLFEIWPVDDAEFFSALCLSMDGILSRIDAEDILQAVNADREAGSWELIEGVEGIEEPLNAHLRKLCDPVVQAAEKMETEKLSNILQGLFQDKAIDMQGYVAQALASAYSIRIHEKAEKAKKEIEKETECISKRIKEGEYFHTNFAKLEILGEHWFTLAGPLREIPGTVRNEDRSIGQGMRNLVVEYVNRAPLKQRQKTFTLHNLVGNNRRVTITYSSKREAAEKALEMTEWMKRWFSTHIDLSGQLDQDLEQLRKMISDEDEMLKRAEKEERDKHPLSF